jgi:hypothetical protein
VNINNGRNIEQTPCKPAARLSMRTMTCKFSKKFFFTAVGNVFLTMCQQNSKYLPRVKKGRYQRYVVLHLKVVSSENKGGSKIVPIIGY